KQEHGRKSAERAPPRALVPPPALEDLTRRQQPRVPDQRHHLPRERQEREEVHEPEQPQDHEAREPVARARALSTARTREALAHGHTCPCDGVSCPRGRDDAHPLDPPAWSRVRPGLVLAGSATESTT